MNRICHRLEESAVVVLGQTHSSGLAIRSRHFIDSRACRFIVLLLAILLALDTQLSARPFKPSNQHRRQHFWPLKGAHTLAEWFRRTNEWHRLNAAIGALNTKGHDSMIPEVLAWSRQYRIEPDVSTYTTLISASIRNGRHSEAMNMLRRMREKNIEANEDTWSVLLAAMFNDASINTLSPEELEMPTVGSQMESVCVLSPCASLGIRCTNGYFAALAATAACNVCALSRDELAI